MASKQKNEPKKVVKKKKNGYEMPKELKSGDVLTDQHKKSWKIGKSIGIGGFGEIYSACAADKVPKKVDDYQYVVKLEPHQNGPLFVEMHFYMRNAKLEEIEKFKKEHKIKTLGVPIFMGSGSHDIENTKHRFLVMPRYGQDIWKIFLEQNKQFPIHTVYRLGWQLTNALEYIHKCAYVHMDIKGSNIMLGFGKGGDEQIYLLDYGLACKYNTKEFKADPKKMHNGTIEYTSRDAHIGVPTMRGDMEILGYNLIEWAGAQLPWVAKNILAKPVEVQKAKEDFMKNIDTSLKSCFGTASVPGELTAFMKYVTTLEHDTEPDFKKVRQIFETGLKQLSKSNAGVLEFKSSKVDKPAKGVTKKTKVAADVHVDVSPPKKSRAKPKDVEVSKPQKAEDSTQKRAATKRATEALALESDSDADDKSAKRVQRKRNEKVAPSIDSDENIEMPKPEKQKVRAKKSPARSPARSPTTRSKSKENHIEENSAADMPSPRKKQRKENGEQNAKGTVFLKSTSSSKSKTIQLNFNLDISMDSDVVVVVNRKDKKKDNLPDAKNNNSSAVSVKAGEYNGKKAKAT